MCVLPADSWCVVLAAAVCVSVLVFVFEPSVFGLPPPAGGVKTLQPGAPPAACSALIGCCLPPAADAPAPLINENSIRHINMDQSIYSSVPLTNQLAFQMTHRR